ncbi:MAG: hypothetical protein JWR03_419 [Cohnella sp.]|nr:hypothetical protein [Cohnella sp.]
MRSMQDEDDDAVAFDPEEDLVREPLGYDAAESLMILGELLRRFFQAGKASVIESRNSSPTRRADLHTTRAPRQRPPRQPDGWKRANSSAAR